jgi:hypothetical protein
VEGRVEDGHLGHARKEPLRESESGKSRRVVEGGERLEAGDPGAHVRIDDDGPPEAIAAVDDTVGDGVDRARINVLEHLDGIDRPVLGDQVQLQARRARVDDQDGAHGD